MVEQADGDRIVTSPIWYTRAAVPTATAVAAAPLAVDVFPNPAVGGAATVSYFLERPETVKVAVLDVLGREVLTAGGAELAGLAGLLEAGKEVSLESGTVTCSFIWLAVALAGPG